MFSKPLMKAVLMPPKNGTTTVDHIMHSMGDVSVTGHWRKSELSAYLQELADHPNVIGPFDPTAVQYAACVREPVSRLVSVINFLYARVVKSGDASSLIDALQSGKYSNLVAPQSAYVDDETGVTLFKMDNMEIVRWLGWTDEIPHLNPTQIVFPRQILERLPKFTALLDRYAADFTLYERSAL